MISPLNTGKNFFPDPLPLESLNISPFGVAVDDYTLTDLGRMFWRSKSIDWSANVTWNNTLITGNAPDILTQTDNGTMIGGGTISVLTPQNSFPGIIGSLPAERIVPINDMGSFLGGFPLGTDMVFPISPNPTVAGNGTRTFHGTTSNFPYNGNFESLNISWFAPQNLNSSNQPGVPYYLTRNGSGYRARISLPSFQFRAYLAEQLSTSPGIATSVSLTIKMTGIADKIIPLNIIFPETLTSRSYTGNITIDFNNFW